MLYRAVNKKCATDVAACGRSDAEAVANAKEAAVIAKAYIAAKIPKEQLEIMPVEYQQALRQKYRFVHKYPSTVRWGGGRGI